MYKLFIALILLCALNIPTNANANEVFFLDMNSLLEKSEKEYPIQVPRSISLAQIALETGYGTSLAFKKRNNLFGLTLNGKPLKFDSKEESVKSYLYSLSFNEAYALLRKDLKKKRNKQKIIASLSESYSENPKYAVLIRSIIKKYSLEKYDNT